jgi:pyruvate/2-oxoglutarate/acetoin dehydrogenase E1 component
MATLAETIREITRTHLVTKQGRLYAQCVCAVGWIGGSVPELTEEQGIVELPTSDVSNGGIVTGAALAGERPIYVVRYQGFLGYNMVTILNYAAKSLEMWGQSCPVLVRALGMEGAMGPVAGGVHHGSIMRYPGVQVLAPVTPKEWKWAYDTYMQDNRPYVFSEHRATFGNTLEFEDVLLPNPHATIFLIGRSRLYADAIRQRLPNCNIAHIVGLQPLGINTGHLSRLTASKFGVVVDSEHTTCGAGEHLAYELMRQTGKRVMTLGLLNRTAGFGPTTDNLTPDVDDIVGLVGRVYV